MTSEICFDAEVKHDETVVGGALGLWLPRHKPVFWVQKVVGKIIPFAKPYFQTSVPADYSDVKRWDIGDEVEIVVRNKSLDDEVNGSE